MIEGEAIKRRGAEQGLRPHRERVKLGEKRREWRDIAAWQLEVGDVWADHGIVVTTVYVNGAYMVEAGDPERTFYDVDENSTVRAYVRVKV